MWEIHHAENGVRYQINATITKALGRYPTACLEKSLLGAQRIRASIGIKRKRKASDDLL